MAYPLIKSKLDRWYKFDAFLDKNKSYNKTSKANYEIFVANDENNQPHLLGYRSKEYAYLFPETECAAGDEGILKLPKGRKGLSDLVKGDKLKLKDKSIDVWVYLGI